MDAFAQRAQCVVDEYGQHVPASCASVVDYGTQTLTEDLADLIGFRVSYNAFVASSQNVTVDDQHSFFYAYAQMWCSVSSVQRECQQMQQDVHAIPSMRVDSTLRHTPEFKQAFGCPSRTNMVPKPYDPVCAIYGV
jgi:endothelin-converting enzyme